MKDKDRDNRQLARNLYRQARRDEREEARQERRERVLYGSVSDATGVPAQ